MTNIKVLYITIFLAALVVCSGQCLGETGYPQMASDLQRQFQQSPQGGSQDPGQMINSALSLFSDWMQKSQEQLQQLQQQPQVQQMIQQLQQQPQVQQLMQQLQQPQNQIQRWIQKLQQQPQMQQMVQQLQQQPQVQQLVQQLQQQPQVQQLMHQLQQQPQMAQLMQQLQQQSRDPMQQMQQFADSDTLSASRLTQHLSRRKRAVGDDESNSDSPVTIEVNTDGDDESRSNDDQQPQIQIQLNSNQQKPSQEDVAAYDASLNRHENQLQAMIRRLQSSPYMPTSEQMVQLLTAVLTLALMLQFGPIVGTNIALIQSIVRQLVPMVMAAATFAADQGSSVINGGGQAGADGISNVPLQPVAAPSSAMGQAF